MDKMRDAIERKRKDLDSSPSGQRFAPSLPVWKELP